MSAFIHHGFRGGYIFGWLPVKILQWLIYILFNSFLPVLDGIAVFLFGVKMVTGAAPDLMEALCRASGVFPSMKTETHTGAINSYMVSGWRVILLTEWWLHTFEDKIIWHHFPQGEFINNIGFWISCVLDALIIYHIYFAFGKLIW
jgi:hypothetical protein